MAVKGKLLIILSGVALLHLFLLGGLALTGGCSSDDEQPINDQNYVPAPTTEQPSAQPAPSPAPVTEFNSPAAPSTTFTPAPLGPQASEFVHSAPAGKGEGVKYTVQKGDSPWKIAKKYGISVSELLSYNQLSSAKSMKVGQVLTIPPGGKIYEASEKTASKKPSAVKKAPVAAGTISPEAKAEHAEKKASAKKGEKAEEHVAGSGETYAVQSGDTLGKIAHKFHVKTADLASANNIPVDKMLHVGQKLTIPKGSAAVASKTEKSEKADKAEKSEKTEKAEKADGKTAKASAKKHAKADAKDAKDAEKATDSKDAGKSDAKGGKTGDSLLDEIPSPDEGPSAGAGKDAVKPLASNAAVNSAASVAGEKAASSGYTAEVDQDTTVEKLATQYGCKADDIKKLNPELPADGKVKAGSVIKIP